jgi:hypothetical protein
VDGVILDFVDTVKLVVIQPVISYCRVVTLDTGLLLRFAGLDKSEMDATPFLVEVVNHVEKPDAAVIG